METVTRVQILDELFAFYLESIPLGKAWRELFFLRWRVE